MEQRLAAGDHDAVDAHRLDLGDDVVDRPFGELDGGVEPVPVPRVGRVAPACSPGCSGRAGRTRHGGPSVGPSPWKVGPNTSLTTSVGSTVVTAGTRRRPSASPRRARRRCARPREREAHARHQSWTRRAMASADGWPSMTSLRWRWSRVASIQPLDVVELAEVDDEARARRARRPRPAPRPRSCGRAGASTGGRRRGRGARARPRTRTASRRGTSALLVVGRVGHAGEVEGLPPLDARAAAAAVAVAAARSRTTCRRRRHRARRPGGRCRPSSSARNGARRWKPSATNPSLATQRQLLGGLDERGAAVGVDRVVAGVDAERRRRRPPRRRRPRRRPARRWRCGWPRPSPASTRRCSGPRAPRRRRR